jgi:ABC-type glycerol-3-phosphate transport system permease component
MVSWAAGHGMYFLILYSFFVNLHNGFEDAGRIDGASEFRIAFQLMLPMAVPMLVAIFISFWTGVWNDHYTVLLYLPSYPTVAAGLFRYKEVAAFTLDIPTYFAGIIIGAIPTTIIFIIFSDTIMKNLTIGGLKG